MEKQAKKSERRSAAEWKSLVEAWKKSGLSSTEFGEKHGVDGARLTWWKWHLGRSGRKQRHRAPVKLVEVDVVADTPSASQWELHTAAGDKLRVTESLTVEELAVILRALGLHGRHR